MSLSDFTRVNGPRVEKVLHIIGMIEKSAVSYRVTPGEFQGLIDPIRQKVRGPEPEKKALESHAGADVTPYIKKEMADMSDLSTQQLLDRLLAAAEVITRRRK